MYEGCDFFSHNMSDLKQKRKRRINVKRKGTCTSRESERENKWILHASVRGRVSQLSFEFGLPMISLQSPVINTKTSGNFLTATSPSFRPEINKQQD